MGTTSSINVISKLFRINKDHYNENFDSIENKETTYRVSFFFDKDAQAHIRQMVFINRKNRNKYSFSTNTSIVHKWMLKNGTMVQSIIPPLWEIVITDFEALILAAPFKIGRPEPENNTINLGDIKKIYHQSDCINQILHIISE